MPYASGGRLPAETASKLGHLAVIESEWVRSLVDSFAAAPAANGRTDATGWTAWPVDARPLRRLWVVDGSWAQVASPDALPKEVSFVKAAAVLLDLERIEGLDADEPHPLLLADLLRDTAVWHATVLPLRNIHAGHNDNHTAVRHIVRDSWRIDEGGHLWETLKWLAYRKWREPLSASPGFECPWLTCGGDITSGLPADADETQCPHCGRPVFLSDMVGLHMDMGEDAAGAGIASSYMMVAELLMLFTPLRLAWKSSNRRVLEDTLFLKDGPLTLRGQYSKLVEPIREFFAHARAIGRVVHVVGQEKTGRFVDHLAGLDVGDDSPLPSYAVLSHRYVRGEVDRARDAESPYGSRTNWGEKLYVRPEATTRLVLSVPVGGYDPDPDFPGAAAPIGLDRILETVRRLVSRRHDHALYPIELANGIASLSSYPSTRILEQFLMASRD